MGRWQARPNWSVFTGHGIGDMLWGGTYVPKLISEVPETRWTYYSTHPWRERFFCHATFPVYARLQQEDAYLHCIPREITPGEHPLDAHHGRATYMHDLPPISAFAGDLLFFGDRPARSPEWVGLFRTIRGGLKTCSGIEDLASCLPPCEARVAPAFASGDEAVAWLSRCRIFVGPETGLTHLAAALGIPCLLIVDGRFLPSSFAFVHGERFWANRCTRAPCQSWRHKAPCREGPGRRSVEDDGYPCLRAVRASDLLPLVDRLLSAEA